MPALREPAISLATRYRPSQSPPRTLLTPAGFGGFIRVEDPDSSFEIIGPAPVGVAPVASLKPKLAPIGIRPSKLVNIQERVQTDSVTATEKQAYDDKKRTDVSFVNKSPALPIYSYLDYPPSPIMVYTNHEDEANDLVQTLQGPIGFDMEWRVLFYANAPERPTALIQVCDKNVILLIHVSSMKRFPEKLRELIESRNIAKIGVNILNDGRKLFRDFGILANNLIELSTLAKQADPDFDQTFGSSRTIVSLAKIVANYCGKTLPKGKERTGNWEGKLGPNMLAYAANDAHCALIAYRKLLAMATHHKRTLHASGYTRAVTFTVLEYNAPPAPKPTTPAPSGAGFVRRQHLRAYSLWHRDKLPLDRICAKLRSEEEPLKESTVISYVIGALESNASLPFDMTKLIALAQMEAGSWRRHREFIMKLQREGRGQFTKP